MTNEKETQDWASEDWDNYLEPETVVDPKELSFEEFLAKEEEGGQ